MNSDPIHLLDHGFVRLVDSMGGDLSIVRAARVSYDADWRAGEDTGSDERLINYMMEHQHSTPFEAVTLTFEVKAPIFVFRQWHRHRTWSYNELSARYRELPEEFYVPHADDVTSQDAKNKQSRTTQQIEYAESARDIIREHSEAAFRRYRQLLHLGVARELARLVLPVNTYTHMFATVNLLNLFKFLRQRCDSHAQYEIRVYANAMLLLTRDVAPVACAAFCKHVLKHE